MLIDLEEGFDYMYLDASDDDGAGWINIQGVQRRGHAYRLDAFTFGLRSICWQPYSKSFAFVLNLIFFVEYDGVCT